jgi:hypothetical protein
MTTTLPTTTVGRFRLPNHPPGVTLRPINNLYHKQGRYLVGWGPGATEEPLGLEYEVYGSDFGWRRIAKGEKPRYIMDDPARPTPERHELGDLDETLWPIGSDEKPLDPWSRVAQLNLVRMRDGTPLIFEASATSARQEVEDLVTRICWLARDKNPDARPILMIGARQVRNAKNQSWWIPTFTIIRWDEPDGTVILPEPEPRRALSEDPTLPAKVSPEAMYAIGGAPPAAPRERKPRNAYRQPAKAQASLQDDLDDEIPF